jgi:hypothetical protein
MHRSASSPIDGGLRILKQALEQRVGIFGATIVNQPDGSIVCNADRHWNNS